MVSSDEKFRSVLGEFFLKAGYKPTVPFAKDCLSFKNDAVRFTREFLRPDEMVDGVLMVVFGEAFLWTTNRRIIFVSSVKNGMFDTAKPVYKEFYYDSIASVQTEKGRLLSAHKIIFHIATTSATGYVANSDFQSTVDFKLVQEFAEHVRDKIAALGQANVDETGSANSGEKLIAQLERLANLRVKGAISEDEFNAAKKKLLDL